MAGVDDFIDREVEICLGTNSDAQFPENAVTILQQMVDGELVALRPMFPAELSDDDLQEEAEYLTDGADFYKLGYHINFTASSEFDLAEFVDTLLTEDGAYLEACMTVFAEDEEQEPVSVALAGREVVDDPMQHDWKLLQNYKFNNWILDRHDNNRAFLEDEVVCITGSVDEYDTDELSEEISALGGAYRPALSSDTTLLVVGRDSERSVVDEAINKNVTVVTEKFMLGLIGLGDMYMPDQARVEEVPPEPEPDVRSLPANVWCFVRELNFQYTDGDSTFEGTGRSMNSVYSDLESAKKALPGLKKRHDREFESIADCMENRRVFDIVELESINTLYLVVDGSSGEPRLADEFMGLGEFLIYGVNENATNKLALADFAPEDLVREGGLQDLTDDVDALEQLIKTGKGIKYSKADKRLQVSERSVLNNISELNDLLKQPFFKLRKTSPQEIMKLEQGLDQVPEL
jgi:hypothetical protein